MRTLNVHYIPTTKLRIACLQIGSCVSFIFIWMKKKRHECFIGIWNGYVARREVFKEGYFCTSECVLLREGRSPKGVSLRVFLNLGRKATRVHNLPLRKQLWFDFLNSFLFLKKKRIFQWERGNISNWGAPLA
jgi:hypothetical protein